MRSTLWVRRAISHATSCDQLPSCLGGSQPHGLDKPSPGNTCALAAVPPAYNERETNQPRRNRAAGPPNATGAAPPDLTSRPVPNLSPTALSSLHPRPRASRPRYPTPPRAARFSRRVVPRGGNHRPIRRRYVSRRTGGFRSCVRHGRGEGGGGGGGGLRREAPQRARVQAGAPEGDDVVQDAGHLLLDDDALHGDHAAVREQPAVRGAGVPRLGMGRRLLLHLVRRRRHGRDLLLLPDHWFSVFLGCTFGWSSLGSFGVLVLRLAGGHRPHCRNWHTGICRIPSTAEHHSTLYWHQHRRWLSDSTLAIPGHVHRANPDLGRAQHFRARSHRLSRRDLHVVAGDRRHRHRGDAPAGGQDHAAGVVRVHPFPDCTRGDWDQQRLLCRRTVLPGEPVLPVRVRRGGAPDGGDQGRRQERTHRHPLQHRHHHRVRVGVHPRSHLQHPGLQLPVQPEQRDGGHVRAGADPVRRVPRSVPQLGGRHRAALCHLGLLLLRRSLHHDERRPRGVRAVPRQGRPLLVGVAPDPPAAQGPRERGVAVRGVVRAAGPADPAHQRGVHGHHLRGHHRVGGRVRGAHLRAHGDAGGGLPAGALLPGRRQPARLPRRVPVDLLHLRRVPAAHDVPYQDGHLQLRAHRAGGLPRPHHALVGARRQEVVQGPRQEHRRAQRQRQGLSENLSAAKPPERSADAILFLFLFLGARGGVLRLVLHLHQCRAGSMGISLIRLWWRLVVG